MSSKMFISRRTALKGMGVAIGLPVLEAMMPSLSYAAPPVRTFPNRMAFVYVPNGVNMYGWTPSSVGPLGDTLPDTLTPLHPFRNDLLVLSGLTVDKARPNGDGPDRKSTRLNSSHTVISYAVFCLKKKSSEARN